MAERSPIQFWPWGKRLRLLCDRQLRRSYRLFRLFPPVACRFILDVGADRGTFTDRALRCFEADRVWLVEANPEAAAALQRKYAGEPRCQVIPCAIGAKSGQVQFHVATQASSSAVQLPKGKVARVVTVPAISLDDLFQQEQIAEVDLMKVDIQGAERMLIQGGQQALKRVQMIYIEVLFKTDCSTAALFGELHELLTAAGFRLRLLHRLRRDEQGFLQQGDALYARSG